MEYQINNAKVRYKRIIVEILIKTFVSSLFLLIGITQSEISSFIIGFITTTVCIYALLKFLVISKIVSYNDKHVLVIDGQFANVEAVSLIKSNQVNFILKFMWSIAKNRFSLIPPDDLIEIYIDGAGTKKKYSFIVNSNDPSMFMTFISHIRAHYPHIKVDI